MPEDIFEFWSRCPKGARIHPDDEHVFARVDHHFDLNCLPAPFTGPLRHADVVLLFIAPGFDEFDLEHAVSEQGQNWYARQISGTEPLPSVAEHRTHYGWWTRIIRQFGISAATARHRMAVLDMAPYHSRGFHDGHMLTALPSSRVAVDWAQRVLFPDAIEGDRLVVCLRAAERWGLRTGECFGKALFAPEYTRGGVMLHGPMRERISAAVQERISG